MSQRDVERTLGRLLTDPGRRDSGNGSVRAGARLTGMTEWTLRRRPMGWSPARQSKLQRARASATPDPKGNGS